MGVIERRGPQGPGNKENTNIQNIVDSQPGTSDDELSIPETVSSQASTLRAQPVHAGFGQGKKPSLLVVAHPGKHSGKRRLRHYRAVEDLLRWNDKDEYEMSIYDFMSGRPSPFAILLNDDNLLKAWWEFITKTNENFFSQSGAKPLSLDEILPGGAPEETKRLLMPSEYKRIERHLKEVLQRKSTNPEMVAEVEQLLAKFFAETPKEMLRIKKLTKYESMINQAVCQYHGLEAEADELIIKKRSDLLVSMVSEDYVQPNTTLSQYIEQRQKYFM